MALLFTAFIIISTVFFPLPTAAAHSADVSVPWPRQPVLQVQQGHRGAVNAVAYSPSGKVMATAGADGLIKLWHSTSGKELLTIDTHKAAVNDLLFLSENQLVSASSDRTIIISDLSALGQRKKQFYGHQSAITALATNTDGSLLATTATDGHILIWDAAVGRIEKRWLPPSPVQDLFFLPNQPRVLVTASESGKVQSWNAETGELITEIVAHAHSAVNSIALSADGQTLATASSDQTIKIWDNRSGRLLRTLFGHDAGITQLSFSKDSRQLFSGDATGEVWVWDAESFQKVRSMRGHLGAIQDISSDNRGYLATASTDETIRIWDISTGYERKKLAAFGAPLHALVMHPTASIFAVGGSSRYLLLHDQVTGVPIQQLEGHHNTIRDLAYSPDGQTLVSASEDARIIAWEGSSGRRLRTFSGHNAGVLSIAIDSSGSLLASGSKDHTVKVWDLRSTLLKFTGYGHTEPVNTVAFHPRKMWLASGSDDGTCKIWEADTGKPLHTLNAHGGGVKTISFSPDGKLLATGGADQIIRVWETSGFTQIMELKGTSATITALAFDATGERLASGSANKIVRVWNVNGGRLRATFAQHDAKVTDVAFSKDGRKVLSVSEDGLLKAWSLEEGVEALALLTAQNGRDFVIYNLFGQYDGTQRGTEDAVHFVQGQSVVPLAAMQAQYFTPDLWESVMLGQPSTTPTVIEASSALRPVPETALTYPPYRGTPEGFTRSEKGLMSDSAQIDLTFWIGDMGGGIRAIQLLQNGKTVYENDSSFLPLAKDGHEYEIKVPVRLLKGKNRFILNAQNLEGQRAVPYYFEIAYKTFVAPSSDLYILAVGIDDYENSQYQLNYALKDAEAFLGTVTQGSKNIFRNVHPILLKNREADKAAILKAFSKVIAEAKEEDVFIFYFSGHGVVDTDSRTADPIYYLCPYDVTKMYGSSEHLKLKGFSANKLSELSRSMKPQKQLILLDACQSGAAPLEFTTRGAIEEKAIQQLARSKGLTVIAASGTEQLATEVRDLGHGIFTYSLLEALRGASDGIIGDKKVTVGEIRTYLDDRIPELSRKYRSAAQYPTAYSSGQDFPIVLVNEQVEGTKPQQGNSPPADTTGKQ